MAESERYRSRSFWLDTLGDPYEPRPPLPGDVSADVAIIGAGYTGLWTAYYLSEADPWLRDRRPRGRDRRLRRVGPQRRLVLGVAAGEPHGAGRPARPRRRPRPAAGDDRRPSTRWAASPTRRTSTASSPRAAPSPSPPRPPHVGPHPGRDRGRARLRASATTTSAGWDRPRPPTSSPSPACSAPPSRPHCAALHPARLVRGLAEVVDEERGVPIYEATPRARDRAEGGPHRARHRAGAGDRTGDGGLHAPDHRPAPGPGARSTR